MRVAAVAVWVATLAGCSESDSSRGASGAAGESGSAGTSGSAGMSGSAGSGGSAGCTLPAAEIIDPLAASELAISGDPGAALGIFDLSPVYPAGAPGGALSYSAVAAKNDISSRIAVSPDAGASWIYVASANASEDVLVSTPQGSARCPGGSCSGRLIHEVSSLAYDPSDSAARRWKLFSHSYVVLGADQLAYDWGYIGLYSAAEPQGPWGFEGKAIGWLGEATLSSDAAWTLASAVPELADCVTLTEPAALVLPNGAIQLALGCVALADGAATIRIVLFESSDHAQTFAYRGVLLDGQDALCAGSTTPQYNAAHLFFAGGRQYLLATATAELDAGFAAYAGCHLFELDAVGGLAVQRTSDGHPIVKRAFNAAGDRFNGACAYAEGASAMGLAVSILRLDAPPQIFRSYASALALP